MDKHITNLTTDNPIEIEPITENGKTESFYVIANSNLNSNKSVYIRIVPKNFYKIISNGDTQKQVYSSVKPTAVFKSRQSTLYNGINMDTILADFYLKWTGNPNLDAGDYISNVIIRYSIN